MSAKRPQTPKEDLEPLRQSEMQTKSGKSSRPVSLIEDKQSTRKSEKQEKAVFLPEERTPRRSWQDKVAQRLKIRNELFRLLLAEFLGTFVLVSIGIGAIAQATLSKRDAGNIVTIMFGWGLGVTMGVYICGGVSGGHINPAVTFAMAILGRLKWRKLPFYMVGQYLGAFLGAFVVWAIYYDDLHHWAESVDERYNASTAAIFATYPHEVKYDVTPSKFVRNGFSFMDQVFTTGLLVVLVMAVTDERNMNPPKGIVPIVVGLMVVSLLSGYAFVCGSALNPARDFAPRVFTAMAGWGLLPFMRGNYFFWVPIVGPHLGAILGAFVYQICVGLHWPDQDGDQLYGNGKA